MNQHALASESIGTFAGFFSHHGWLAPGVKLFRSLSFASKSAWILVSLLIPIVGLLILLYGTESALIDSARVERQGVVYVNAVNLLTKELSDLRHAAVAHSADLREKQASASAAFSKLQEMQKDLGAGFGQASGNHFETLSRDVAALLQKPVLDAKPEAKPEAATPESKAPVDADTRFLIVMTSEHSGRRIVKAAYQSET